jgi:hypothetical protein
MSTTDRKAKKKARLQAKKKAQIRDRLQSAKGQAIQEAMDELRQIVLSGQARIAVATILELRTVVAAMWESDGVQVRAYSTKEEASIHALSMAAVRHVSEEEWAAFMLDHTEAVAAADEDDFPISLVQWKPGEGPQQKAPSSEPTQTP